MGHKLSLLRRLTDSANDLDAAELLDEVGQRDCSCLNTVTEHRVATVGGRVRSVVYTPSETVPTLSAELFDGSGSLTLVWLGRRRIAGIEPGRFLIARGRVAEHEGHPAMYNPWYELQCRA